MAGRVQLKQTHTLKGGVCSVNLKGTQMFTKTITFGHAVFAALLSSGALLGQARSAASGSSAVGTKVEAKLAVATLVTGVVVPQDAILSGEVTESVAKSASGPARLA